MMLIKDFSRIFVRYDLLEGKREVLIGLKAKAPILQEVMDCVIKGNYQEIEVVVNNALTAWDPLVVIKDALVPAMEQVGSLWEEGIYYLPQTLNASDAMDKGVNICEKKMGRQFEKKGVVVTHTAEGDIHDLGQKIVNALLRSHGFEVIDLGKDVPVETVIEAVKKFRPMMLTGTAGLTINMNAFKLISQRLQQEKIEIPFICGGGGGISPTFITSFCLGVYGKDAAQAPLMANDVANGTSWQGMKAKYNENA
jgi:methanol corrinoid protein